MPTQTLDPMPAHTSGGSGKGLAQPCRVQSWKQSLAGGGPPPQQTLAMPEFAGVNSGDAGDCWCKQRRCWSLSEGCSPKRYGLGAAPTPPNPTNHLPVARPRDCRVSTAPADPGKIIRAVGNRRRWSAPGPAPPPFSQGWGWALPAASPQIQACAAAPTRVPDWPWPSRNSRSLPIAPSANKEGRKHLAEAEPCTTVLVRGGGLAAPGFASVLPTAAEANKGEPRASAATPLPSPPPPFSLLSNPSHLPRCRRGPALFPASGWAGVKVLQGRDGHSGTGGG